MVDVFHKRCAHVAAPSSRAMASQVPRRRSSALDTPRMEWWTSSASSVPTLAAPSTRAMAWQVPRRRSSALDTPRMEWWTSSTSGCAHRGCTKRPSYGVAGTKTAEFCSGHAKDGMVRVSDSRNPCSVRGRSGGARGCGGAEMDGCTARRSGAGENKRRRSLVDTRQAEPSSESSSRSSRADSKRSRQATVNTPVTPPTSIGGTAEDETHAAPDANISVSEPDDAAVKTEVATVSSKVVAIEVLPAVETTAGESATSVGYNLCAERDGSVKTEVGIVFPSKLAAPGVATSPLSVDGGAYPRRVGRHVSRDRRERHSGVAQNVGHPRGVDGAPLLGGAARP
ncbi:unnamed protein product [Pylaiella littoralis]